MLWKYNLLEALDLSEIALDESINDAMSMDKLSMNRSAVSAAITHDNYDTKELSEKAIHKGSKKGPKDGDIKNNNVKERESDGKLQDRGPGDKGHGDKMEESKSDNCIDSLQIGSENCYDFFV